MLNMLGLNFSISTVAEIVLLEFVTIKFFIIVGTLIVHYCLTEKRMSVEMI